MSTSKFAKTQRIKIRPGDLEKDKDRKSCIMITSRHDMGKIFFIHKEEMIIGREEGVDIRINHPHVSRNHAQLILKDKRTSIKDLNSTNGTFVNSESVLPGKQVSLSDGDRILIGDITMVFLLVYPTFTDEEELS